MEAVAVTATCDCVSDAKPKGSKCPNCAVVLTSRQKRAVVILALVTVTLCGLMSLPSALYFSTKVMKVDHVLLKSNSSRMNGAEEITISVAGVGI